MKGRTTWYETADQMQTDLEMYLHHYNDERPHQGRVPVICESDAA